MTTLRTIARTADATSPRLDSGDRMDAETFMAIYEQMPEGFRAQLIRGVVYVTMPMTTDHGGSSSDVVFWLGAYRMKTPGLTSFAGVTTRLGPDDSPEPDVVLAILPEHGGQSRVEGKYLIGAPELIVEVSYSTRAYDLNDKLAAYREAGVREYIVVLLGEARVLWMVLHQGRYEPLSPGEDGVLRSTVFPGLWLDATALLARDLVGIFAAVGLGTATPEHAAFVARLAEAGPA